MDPLNPVWGYRGSFDDAGFEGLLYLSGLSVETTIVSCLTQFPDRYEWIREAETLGPDPLNGLLFEDLGSDPAAFPSRATLLIGRVVEESVRRGGPYERMIAVRLGLDPDATPVTRIHGEYGAIFEWGTQIDFPGALDCQLVGELVIAAVLFVARTPEGIPNGFVLACDQVTRPFLMSDYGLGLAGNYARSCLNQVLSANVDLRPYDDATSHDLRRRMRTVHSPNTEADLALIDEMSSGIPEAFTRMRQLVPTMPAARLVKTSRDAEGYAAEVMQALGFRNSRVTPPGNDGGIDVVSDRGVAQVKMEGLPTGRPAVQRLAGAAFVEKKIPLFFSLAGYTQQAQAWAELAGVAAFEFAFDGEITPRTDLATTLLRSGLAAEV